MQTDDKTLNEADKQEFLSKLELLIETYRKQFGTGWIAIFERTVKIDATNYLS